MPRQPGKFICPDCGRRYASEQNLNRHRKEEHAFEPQFRHTKESRKKQKDFDKFFRS